MKVLEQVKSHVLDPKLLHELRSCTHFETAEIDKSYKLFMADSPYGTIGLERFKTIYNDIFPTGNAKLFAEDVFRCFDDNGSNSIEFREFLCALSVISRGSLDEKLSWVFKFYDKDNNGYIDKEELYSIIKGLFKMHGSEAVKSGFKLKPKELSDKVFQTMDLNSDGKVTFEEFKKAVMEDATTSKLLNLDPHLDV